MVLESPYSCTLAGEMSAALGRVVSSVLWAARAPLLRPTRTALPAAFSWGGLVDGWIFWWFIVSVSTLSRDHRASPHTPELVTLTPLLHSTLKILDERESHRLDA